MESLFHDHLAAVLLGHATRRLDFRELVTRMDVSGKLDGRYKKGVADVRVLSSLYRVKGRADVAVNGESSRHVSPPRTKRWGQL